MRCFVCGRFLVRAAATLQTADGTGYAGPTCARARGLLAPTVTRQRLFTIRARRKKADTGQLELTP